MTVTLTLLALKQMRPGATHVIWPRIDQKSCLKAVSAAGCTPVVVENLIEGDELRTDVAAIRGAIAEVGAARVLCVLTTTSCFAPRAVDKLLEIGRMCHELDVPHIANNAYGVQCAESMKAISAASRHGRESFLLTLSLTKTRRPSRRPRGTDGSAAASP
jgi:O-phospho-L-seryl-tRNASec:L-selenocysteinyl-tRNA synthase